MISLNYRSSRPIYLQIADGLQRQIVTGVLEPGEKLPSVRELAAELSINPNTIQRSYRELELGGWTVSIPGKGNFVCRKNPGADPEREKMLEEFDRAAEKLLALGISPEELRQRIGGADHA